MYTLLSALRKQQREFKRTSYLDTLLVACTQDSELEIFTENTNVNRTTKPLLDNLSPRELEVLQLIAEGASNEEIAMKLVLAVNTVKRHVSNILAKLVVSNRTQAAAHARELGLLNEKDALP